MTYPNFKYTGSTPGADSNTYPIFSTVTAFPMANGFQMMGIHRLLVSFVNTQSGTLKGYASTDRGATWTQVDSNGVLASPANGENQYDFLVEPYMDFKLDWVNGGSAQSTWIVRLTGVTTRQVAT